MKLHSDLVQQSEATALILSAPAKPLTASIHLKLTIRFYKQSIQVPGGQVEFGLKRGELNVRLTNGKIPLEKMGLTQPFEIEVEVDEQQEVGREAELNVAVSGGIKGKDSIKTSTKTKTRLYRVTNRGLEENPIWEFAMKPSLTGQLTEAFLGTIEMNGEPCSIEAMFVVCRQSDIELFDATGLVQGKHLSRNKTALAAREIFLRFIAPKLQPYLSRVEGQL